MGETDHFLLDGLVKELDELKLPSYVETPIRRSLDTIKEINGTRVPEERRHKEVLFCQVTGQIAHFRFVKEMQKQHLDGCPVNRMVKQLPNGQLEMPWTGEIREAVAKYAAPGEGAGESFSEFSVPFGTFKAKGKGAWIFPVALAFFATLLVAIGTALYIQNASFKKLVTQKLEMAVQERAVNNNRSVTRSDRVREDIRDEVDAYEPSN